MRFQLTLLLAKLLCFAVSAVYGQALQTPPEIDVASVIRRGDHVEHITGFRAPDDEAFDAVMGPPADDSHKWFITVISQANCKPCEKLKADWGTSKNLRAFAIPEDPKTSWSHFNLYKAGDATQDWRWKNIKVAGYPTILVQPPRNGQYGDPSTVVLQKTGYGGDDKALAQQIRDGIKKYLEKIQKPIQHTEIGADIGADIGSPERGFKQYAPSYTPELGVSPPFPVQPITPPTPGPAPGPTPPLVLPEVPDAINPDKLPSVMPKPVQPLPVQPLPEQPTPAPLAGEVVTIVADTDLIFSEERRGLLKSLLSKLRETQPNIKPNFVSPEEAAKLFPGRDVKPGVVVTKDGTVVQQIPLALLELLLKDQADLSWISRIGGAISTVWPPAGWIAAGVVLFLYIRRRRQEQLANPTLKPA